ncbi:MAG: GNAT family N-acetyltransferase [Acidimicrobiia bacterium]
MTGEVTIRKLDPPLLETMLDWGADEGWNPGLDDAAAFSATDPEGFLGLFVDDELTVTISAVQYDARFGFVGFYICRPERRGEGLGVKLFDTALDAIDATTVGLDGVIAQEQNYAQSGFVTAHHNVRFGGTPDAPTPADHRVRALRTDDVEKLVAYERDARVFPAQRRRFLERWLVPRRTYGFAIDDGDVIAGYGVIRQCRSGHKIGPLFCESLTDAEVLLAALLGAIDGGEVFLDVPQPNTRAMQLAREIGLSPSFETVRMYRGPDPAIALHRVFGITTFELG